MQANKELYCLTFSSRPTRTHCISPGVIVTSSSAFTPFLTQSANYALRSTYHIAGERWMLGTDMVVLVGVLRHNSRYTSSIVVQLEYAACCQPVQSTFQLLQSVLESVMVGVDESTAGGGEGEAGKAAGGSGSGGSGRDAVLSVAGSYRPSGGWPNFHEFGLGDVWTARHSAVMWLFMLQIAKAAT